MAWWDQEEQEPFAMYAQMAQNVPQEQQLPAGHPSQILRALRDLIPQVQADDSSTTSGITSRLGRTATGIPRAALETMSNWFEGTSNPNAVRVGPDTISPLGMFPMGMAGTAARGASAAARSDAGIARSLAEQFPGEPAIGDMVRTRIAGGNRVGVAGEDGMTPLARTDGAMRSPGDAVTRAPYGMGRPANDLLADNSRSSVPGTVMNSMAEGQRSRRPLTEWEHQSRDAIERPRFSETPAYPMTPEQRAAQFAEWQAESAAIARRAKDGVYSDRKVPTLRADAASAPGLAANSTQQHDSGVTDILRMYGLIP